MIHEQRLAWIAEYGRDPIAVSCLQPRMHFHDNEHGFIAYRKIGNRNITLGAPICAPHSTSALIKSFSEQTSHPIFCYVNADFLPAISTTQLKYTCIGVDRMVDHDALAATDDSRIKSAFKKAYKAGFHLKEFHPASLDDEGWAGIESIQRTYINQFHYKKEITFINAPLGFEANTGKRYFYLRLGEQTKAFGLVALNPFYNRQRIEGYLLDIVRFKPCKLWRVWYSVVVELSRVLHAEHKKLCLGFCPLYDADKYAGNSRVLSWQIQCLANTALKARYFKHLHELKMSIPGCNRPRFIAQRSRNLLPTMHSFLRASDVSVMGMVRPKPYAAPRYATEFSGHLAT